MTIIELRPTGQHHPADEPTERTEDVRRAGFDRLYTDRYRPMLGLAISLVDQSSVAEEIVQEAFQRVWIRWDGLETPKVYLRTAVVNGCHDELRRRRVRRRTDPTLGPSAPAEAHYLVDALSSLNARRREAVVLRFYGGMTMPEVAQAMDIPTGTAKSLVHRALADLRGALAAA